MCVVTTHARALRPLTIFTRPSALLLPTSLHPSVETRFVGAVPASALATWRATFKGPPERRVPYQASIQTHGHDSQANGYDPFSGPSLRRGSDPALLTRRALGKLARPGLVRRVEMAAPLMAVALIVGVLLR